MGLVASIANPNILSNNPLTNATTNQVGSGQAQANINPYLQQQTALANQLQGVANGTGPNPALAQLNQATSQNAAMAAGQTAANRGLNPGEAARLSGQQLTNANQQANGQAATLQAQQQLGALGQLNSVYQSQEGATNAASQTAAGIGAGNQQQQGKLVGGVFNGIGAAAGMANGGQVGTDPASSIALPQFGQPGIQNDGPQSSVGKFLSSGATSAAMATGGKVRQVQTILSPGEGKLTPEQAKKVAMGKEDAMKAAKKVPGKAKVKGDSLSNDTVPTPMEAGSIVLPRSVMMAKNPHWAAHAFVQAHLGLPKGKKK